MTNISVEANILATLPPGTISAEWLDLSEQLGYDYKPETSGIIRASTKDGVIFYAVNGTRPDNLIFLSITLPEGKAAAENDQSTLLPEITKVLNELVKIQTK